MTIDWSNLFKIRIANPDQSMVKHEVVKLLLVMKLLQKYKGKKNFIRIYTEQELENGNKCDVYFEDTKNKVVVAYEIQKQFNKAWLSRKANQYKNWEVPFTKSSDWIPIPLNSLSDNIEEMYKELDKYIF